MDVMVKGVTEKFLEVTMKGYEKIAKEDFGKTLPGIFSDEPNIQTSGGLRWTPDLFSVFKQKWGYDLKPLLPLLERKSETGKKSVIIIWKHCYNCLSIVGQNRFISIVNRII